MPRKAKFDIGKYIVSSNDLMGIPANLNITEQDIRLSLKQRFQWQPRHQNQNFPIKNLALRARSSKIKAVKAQIKAT